MAALDLWDDAIMGIDIWVAARKRILPDEQKTIETYNTMLDLGLPITEEHKQSILGILGRAPEDGWHEGISLDYEGVIELTVDGEGDVMYYDGMVLKLEDLPPGTVELRIYASV